jgi:hypothetical protein
VVAARAPTDLEEEEARRVRRTVEEVREEG